MMSVAGLTSIPTNVIDKIYFEWFTVRVFFPCVTAMVSFMPFRACLILLTKSNITKEEYRRGPWPCSMCSSFTLSGERGGCCA